MDFWKEHPSARVRHYCLERSLVSFIPHPLILVHSPTPFLFVSLFYSHGKKTRLLRRELPYPHAGGVWGSNPEFSTLLPSVLTYMVVLHISASLLFVRPGWLLKETRFLTFRDIGKDLVSGSGHPFPIIQPGEARRSQVHTGTNQRLEQARVLSKRR